MRAVPSQLSAVTIEILSHTEEADNDPADGHYRRTTCVKTIAKEAVRCQYFSATKQAKWIFLRCDTGDDALCKWSAAVFSFREKCPTHNNRKRSTEIMQ